MACFVHLYRSFILHKDTLATSGNEGSTCLTFKVESGKLHHALFFCVLHTCHRPLKLISEECCLQTADHAHLFKSHTAGFYFLFLSVSLTPEVPLLCFWVFVSLWSLSEHHNLSFSITNVQLLWLEEKRPRPNTQTVSCALGSPLCVYSALCVCLHYVPQCVYICSGE